MATSILEAINTAPVTNSGTPVGYDSWRFTVEVLVVASGARVGKAIVGTSRVGAQYEWFDLTPYLVGVEWTRGTSGTGQGLPKANAGVASVTLDNNSYLFSCWNTSNLLYREWTPGALFRVAMHKPGATGTYTVTSGVTSVTRSNWNPVFTGVVESWTENVDVNNNTVTVTLTETTTLIAAVNKNAVSPIGAGETLTQRLVRCVTDISWTYGLRYASGYLASGANSITLQATSLANNRLAEMVLAGDSANFTPVLSGTDGAIRIGMQEPNPSQIVVFTSRNEADTATLALFPNLITAKYIAPLQIVNSADSIINDVSLAFVGGSAQTATDIDSVRVYGLRSYSRTDLINQSATAVATMATDLLSLYGGFDDGTLTDQMLQPGTVTVIDQFDAQRVLDVFDYCYLDYQRPSAASRDIRFKGRVTGMYNNVVRTSTGVIWSSTYNILALSNGTEV